MPVTTRVAPVEVFPAYSLSSFNSTTLFQHACPTLWKPEKTSIIESSFTQVVSIKPTLYFHQESANGFVGTILDAYRRHNHVVIRPDDVWLSILVQFSFYVNAHAEQLRQHFVSHAGKRVLRIEQNHMDFAEVFIMMKDLLHENIKDTNFLDWIMPNFTTTTETDRVAASVMMMGTLQKYFVYDGGLTCGIPSVTLLGDEADWQDILERVDYLTIFGKSHPELKMWQSALRGVIRPMTETFRAPDSPDVVRFWQRAVHSYRDDYLRHKRISGWVLAFCFWDTEGSLLAGGAAQRNWKDMVGKNGEGWWFEGDAFHSLEWADVPSALVNVPIHFDNLGDKFVAHAVAGSVGYTVRDSEQVFRWTRQQSPKVLGFPAPHPLLRHVHESAMLLQSFSKKLTQKLPWFRSNAQSASLEGAQESTEDRSTPACKQPTYQDFSQGTEIVPQLSDLSELEEPWAYEEGGKGDMLQPVTGWWVVRDDGRQYGRDLDVPNVQFDRDAEDYEEGLAVNGRPLREREEL